MASITGRCLRHLKNQPAGSLCWLNDSRFDDCAKRVRVSAGLPVLDSDWRLGGHSNSSH